jgi:methyl-accepting chemotaxis protein
MNLSTFGIRARLLLGFGIILGLLAGMGILAVSLAAQDYRWLIALITVAAVLIGAIGAWWASGSIAGPLQDSIKVGHQMASGDFSQSFEARGAGELFELQSALQMVRERVFDIVSRVRSGTMAIATTSGTIAADNAALSARTESQASSLEQTASSMEELTAAVKQNADNAKLANQLVASASDSALKGGKAVDHVVQTMGSIKESSGKIVDIISVIDNIAFQTNILALNAAVEAARAGDQGRGFAVVATEVRNLAQRSASAAKEIKQLIADSVDKVDLGSRSVDDAGNAMATIVVDVQRVTDIMSEIAAASAEQSAGIEEINRAIVHIDHMTQENASLVEEATRTAAGLQDQAVGLTQAVSDFSLGEHEFGDADDAAAMVRRGVEYVRTHGKARGIDEINNSRGLFVDRDLYLGMCDSTSKIIANGGNPRVIGMDGTQVKDIDGKYFVNEMMEVARTAGGGWVDYKWVHPITKETMIKTACVEAVGLEGLVISCGFYK